MNVKTGIIFVIFCVSLGAVIVGQRLQIRSVGFETAQHDRELMDLRERRRVLNAELARKKNPSRLLQILREKGIPLEAPEGELPEIPGKPKEEEKEEDE
jgi:hypothetical protein